METQPTPTKYNWRTWRLILLALVFLLGFAFILIFVFEQTHSTETTSFVTVRSPDGLYDLTGRKLVVSDAIYFTGLPYAESNGRFTNSEVLDIYQNETATSWPRECPSVYHRQGVEECLTLNVYRCASLRDLHLPVLVYIPEGERETESTANLNPVHVIKNLACRGMVVVSVHYRQSVFSQLTFGNNESRPNLGVSDVHAALQWVHLNIPKFHGNRSRVTVVGSKNGGRVLSYLSRDPKAKELFSNMILVDGALESPHLFYKTNKFLIDQSRRFSRLTACSKLIDELNETSKKKSAKLMGCIRRLRRPAAIRAESRMRNGWIQWPIDSTDVRDVNPPPMNVMLGSCRSPPSQPTEGSAQLRRRLKNVLQTIRDFNRTANPSVFIDYYASRFAGIRSLRVALKAIRQDFTEIGPLLLEANRFAKINSNGTSRVFVFDLQTNQSRMDYEEIKPIARQFPPCLEHLLFKKVPEADVKLQNFMVDAVVNFVLNENPNSPDNETSALEWPEFSSREGTSTVLSLTAEGVDVVTNPWPASSRFWLCEQSKASNLTENCT